MPGLPLIQCTPLPPPDAPPHMRLPHLGLLEKAREGLHAIPSPATYLVKFQDALATALAPVKMYLEILEAVNAIYACMQAIPECIIRLSPTPLYECFKNLTQAVRVILQYLPPTAWLYTAAHLAEYTIDLVDEIIEVFIEVDGKIDQQVRGLDYARNMLNSDLEDLIDCNLGDLQALICNIEPILIFVVPAQKILLDTMYRYLKDPRIKVSITRLAAMQVWLPAAFAAVATGTALPEPPLGLPSSSETTQHASVPIPRLGNLLTVMNDGRNQAVKLYNIFAPLAGLSGRKVERTLPTFTYL